MRRAGGGTVECRRISRWAEAQSTADSTRSRGTDPDGDCAG
jgi:hypothetical protein